MNGQTFGVVSVLIGLFLFGLAYNALVAWIERQKVNEPITWLLVVGGVLVTLGGLHLLTQFSPAPAVLLALAAFTASGTPMVLGSVARYINLYRQALDYEREILVDKEQSKRL